MHMVHDAVNPEEKEKVDLNVFILSYNRPDYLEAVIGPSSSFPYLEA